MVTRGNPADLVPVALGQPGTQVLFGGGNESYGAQSGFRLTIGSWLSNNVGWEASGFFLPEQSFGFSGGSANSGSPSLYYPFYRPDAQREGSIAIYDALRAQLGNVDIVSRSELWGAETNLLFDIGPDHGRWSLVLLGGFRYLGLQEGVYNSAYFSTPSIDVQNSIHESFVTQSQFFGGQFGARLGTCWEICRRN